MRKFSLPYRVDERKEVFPVLVKVIGEVRMKRALISSLCVMLFAGVAFGQGTNLIWLEGDSGGNTVTVPISGTAVIEIWFKYEAADEGGYINRMIGLDAQLRHNKFGTGSATWDAQNGVDFEATELWHQGTFGTLPKPLGAGFNHGGMSDGVLPGAEVYAGNLNKDPVGEDFQWAAGSVGPFDADSGLAGSTTSWFGDQIVIHGLVQNWDEILLTGTPDTLNFPKKTTTFGPGFTDNVYYGGAWSVLVDVKSNQGVGAFGNRLYVRVTPEPTSLALLAIGGLAALRRRR